MVSLQPNIILLVYIGLMVLTKTVSQTDELTLKCPDTTWRIYNDLCYRLSSRADNYADAALSCIDEGAALTSILTSEEQEFIEGLAQRQDVWIGLNDIEKEGTFVWLDGSKYDYTNWGEIEPNNCFIGCGVEGEDCVKMYSSGRWNDAECNIRVTNKYICKTDAILLPTTGITFTEDTSTASYESLITSTTTTVNPSSTSFDSVGAVIIVIGCIGLLIIVLVSLRLFRKRQALNRDNTGESPDFSTVEPRAYTTIGASGAVKQFYMALVTRNAGSELISSAESNRIDAIDSPDDGPYSYAYTEINATSREKGRRHSAAQPNDTSCVDVEIVQESETVNTIETSSKPKNTSYINRKVIEQRKRARHLAK